MRRLTPVAILLTALFLTGCSSEPEDEREVLYWYDPMHPQQQFNEPGPSPFMDMDLVPRYADEVETGSGIDLGGLDADRTEVWSCPMHPQIREDGPGRCPICGMDLVRRGAPAHHPGHIQVLPAVQQTMNIRTAEVRRDRLWRQIDTVGLVEWDESRLHHIHPRTAGWIQEMDISSEGDPVRAGQRLFTLYSPELVNAQDEFLQALRRGEPGLISSSRERLLALDVQPEFIDQLEKSRQRMTAVPWNARMDGVVTRLGARHGMHVTSGDMILEIANLSRVWVIAQVFDRHSDWLAEGQVARISPSYAPGEVHETTVDYIYPRLDATTRTTRVRLVLDNGKPGLKPGMWTSVQIFAGPVEDQIIIPREALIRTGHSERVVLRAHDDHFEVREVTAGMESGEYVAIRSGLEPGETVVTSGQFLIDSEASLQAAHLRLGGQHDH